VQLLPAFYSFLRAKIGKRWRERKHFLVSNLDRIKILQMLEIMKGYIYKEIKA
jgi:hypothetical protein